MNSEKIKMLKDRFWNAETSEAEENWLRGNIDPEEDRMLYDYFVSMRAIAKEQKSEKSGGGKVRRLVSLNRMKFVAAAAAAIFIAIMFAIELFPGSSSPQMVQQQNQLSEEELAVAMTVMDKFHKSWEKGSRTASIPFEKLEKLEKLKSYNHN